ncbi:rod-binding protein [Acidimangrovimonas pyrenivorans]|uniref:Rod-binding protein n=1 Tax=Acidimangrovimonas pyrenivorans TaxID=2030798 RepID=A0ABV7AMT1_9RHOB
MEGIGKPALPPAAATAGGAKRDAEIKKVAQEFEAVFLTQTVDQMMKTVKLGDMDGGHAEATWRSFLAREMAQQIADSGTTGIAQRIETMLKAYKG